MFKILCLFSSHDSFYPLQEAWLGIEKDYPCQVGLDCLDTDKIDLEPVEMDRCRDSLKTCDLVFVAVHGGITCFKSFTGIMDEFAGKKRFFIYSGLEEENRTLLARSGIAEGQYQEILRYYLMGGPENNRNLLLYMAAIFGDKSYLFESPQSPQWEGIYCPGRNVDDEGEYIRTLKKSGKPIVGILFSAKLQRENNTRHIDALIQEIAAGGGEPLAVYTESAANPSTGSRGLQWVVEHLLMHEGRPLVEVIINTMGFSQSIVNSPGDGSKAVETSIFAQLGVPVLQATSTYQDLEGWEESLRGLDMMSLASSVYYPELDGQVITTTIACLDHEPDSIGERNIFRPIPERIRRVSGLALNWAKLRRTPPGRKKVAILLHNMPPRNDTIGCAFGLDTPASVWNMVEALKQEGIYMDYDFANGEEIINRIINGVTNDTRWLQENKALAQSEGVVSGQQYRRWFARFGASVQTKMVRDWGNPPGQFMVFEDKLPVPGIINGNVFIGLQPARGYEEKAAEVYHSSDLVPPHQYLAFYGWLKHSFCAHVIIHVGTHGTLEWLPGKEVGLSGNCYPDLAIGDLPHLYPYIINVPGEGIQVKRRSYGVILDHLIPSPVYGGAYDEIAELDDVIKQYYQAAQGDRAKLPYLQQKLAELVRKNNFDRDLSACQEEMDKDFPGFVGRLHAWIEEIKHSLIKDGLHVLGKVPEEERFANLIQALLRLPNGDTPSLPAAVAAALGMNYEQLRSAPLQTGSGGKTNLMLLENLEEQCRDVIATLHQTGYDLEMIEGIVKATLTETGQGEPLKKCLNFACTMLKPKLEATTGELKYFIEGVKGRFVPPGGSGSPTRGRADILPTGRNFYTIDPAAIPTKAAWGVGIQLANRLLERYWQDEGKYPESIVLVVYAGDTMKTCGDDVAEALYLMGIRPKWLLNTDRVMGLEAISQEELKRPRIDVTLRITGLFRDTFPNLIELLEAAVNLAAGLDEAPDINYLRRHVLQEIQEFIGDGMSMAQAREEAGLRIFGCPPGTYGAGVDILINSRNWQNGNDLGSVYTFWSGHAYGKKAHGRKAQDVFARRLAVADVSVKNETSVETDMLDNDDFYNYFGGLIAAVKTHKGMAPRAYCGDSSDPARTRVKDVREETARVMRARILNPKWFDGLRSHGYKGAQEIAAMVDYVFGWGATTEGIEDWMYSRISASYLFNAERREWIRDVNPWALYSIAERLLEAAQRGMWQAAVEDLGRLRELLLELEGTIEGEM